MQSTLGKCTIVQLYLMLVVLFFNNKNSLPISNTTYKVIQVWGACFYKPQLLQSTDFQQGAVMPPGGHWAMSGEIFGCDNLGKRGSAG